MYKYITNHGLDPMTIPKDVRVMDAKMLPNGRVYFETNRPLTTKELDYYDIKSESESQKYYQPYGL